MMSAYSSKAGILVPLTALRLHGQSPLLLEDAKVKRFADAMRRGDEFPPVQVHKEGEVFHLLDGYHRQQASHQCSFTHIPVEIVRMP
jgi:hypothetical protein